MTIVALAVFGMLSLGMAIGRLPGLAVDRTGVALLGAIGPVLAAVMDGLAVLEASDFPTLIVLFGLMVLSAQFAVCGFYGWCAVRLAAMSVSPLMLLALVTATGGALSAVLANDVVVFAMTPPLVVGLTQTWLDPRPVVLALAAAANAGSGLVRRRFPRRQPRRSGSTVPGSARRSWRRSLSSCCSPDRRRMPRGCWWSRAASGQPQALDSAVVDLGRLAPIGLVRRFVRGDGGADRHRPAGGIPEPAGSA